MSKPANRAVSERIVDRFTHLLFKCSIIMFIFVAAYPISALALGGDITSEASASDSKGGGGGQRPTRNHSPEIEDFTVIPSTIVIGLPVTFSWIVSDEDGDTLTCLLDVDGNGTDDYVINDCADNTSQIHSYAMPGEYTARLTVFDGKGGTDQETVSVEVTAGGTENEAPYIDEFDVDPETTQIGEVVAFSWDVGDSDGDTLTCLLDVGDSVVYTIDDCAHTTTQDHTYTQAGEYTAVLIVNDGNGAEDMESVTVTVNAVNTPPSIVSFSISPSPAYINAESTFSWLVSDDQGDMLTCRLDVDGNGTVDYTIENCSSQTSQTHTFTSAGDYTARLSVSDGLGNTVQDTLFFSVLSPLSVDVSIDSLPAVSAERLLYTITVSNTTSLPIQDVNVILIVPAGLSFNDKVDVEPDPASCNVGSIYYCEPNEEAIWTLGNLSPGESRTISINALVDATLLNGTSIEIPVIVSAYEMNDLLLERSVAVYNSPSADLSLSTSTDAVVANQSFTFLVDAGNTSGGTLTSAKVSARLPAGVMVDAVSDGGTEVSPGVVEWELGSLGVGASVHREIRVTTDAEVVPGQILQAAAELSHDGGLAVDNRAEQVVTVVAYPVPLELAITTSADPVEAGTRVRYTLTVSNTSLLPVDEAIVLLRVPAELKFNDKVDVEPDPASCDAGGSSIYFCEPTEEAVWTLLNLAAGESRTITVNALVDATVLSGNLIETPVRMTSSSMQDVIDRVNTVRVGSLSADLSLSASSDALVANQSFTFNVDAGNISAGTLTSSKLTAQLPAGVTVDLISDGGTEVRPGVVEWELGSLGVGASVHREVQVTAKSDVIGGQILQAAAELSHDGGLAVDNRAEQVVTVVAYPLPLELAITTSADPVMAGGILQYSIIITNNSALPVDDVVVLLRVPAELSFNDTQDVEPDPASCDAGGSSIYFCEPTEEASWDLGTLAAGERRTITIDALVDPTVLSGNLIETPVRTSAPGMLDVIDLLDVVAVHN